MSHRSSAGGIHVTRPAVPRLPPSLVINDLAVDVLAPHVAVATYGLSLDLVSRARREVSAGVGTIVWVRDSDDDSWKIRTLQTGRREVPQAAPVRRR